MITEEDKLPETILVTPNPMPKTKSGGNSLILKCANAKMNAETKIPIIIPKSLDNIGSKTPRNIISSNNGAKKVVVMNKRIKAKLLFFQEQFLTKDYYHFDYQLRNSLLMTLVIQKV